MNNGSSGSSGGTTINLSNYYTKTEVDNKVNEVQAKVGVIENNVNQFQTELLQTFLELIKRVEILEELHATEIKTIETAEEFEKAILNIQNGKSGKYILSFKKDIVLNDEIRTALSDFNTVEDLVITFTSAEKNSPVTFTSSYSIELPSKARNSEFILKDLNFNFSDSSATNRRLIASGNKFTLDGCNLNAGGNTRYSELVFGCDNSGTVIHGKGDIDVSIKDTTAGVIVLTGQGITNETYENVSVNLAGNVTVINRGINLGYNGSGNTINNLNVIVEEDADIRAGVPGDNNGGLFGTINIYLKGKVIVKKVNFDIKGYLSGLGNNDIADNATITGTIDLSKVETIQTDIFSGRNLLDMVFIVKESVTSDKIINVLSGANINGNVKVSGILTQDNFNALQDYVTSQGIQVDLSGVVI